ncbi:MAG: nitroreductase family protein [Ignavibacteriaceae bacterium]|nr:nitroreductase family protein [Ignavibacteriaceae bacterium]
MHIGTTNTALTNDILPLIKKRWSPREFDSLKEISQENLQLLFEAARWAPSSNNEQPWNFIVVTKNEPEQFNKMIGVLLEGNKQWASKASALVLTVASLRSAKNNTENFHALYDLGACVANLSLQAIELDIFTHQMGGFYHDKAKKVFQLKENYTPVSVIALGYLPENESFVTRKEEVLAKRKRKSLNEFVFKNNWGNPFFEVNDFQKN